MKLYNVIPLIVALLAWPAHSQTADAWVSQGRSYLAAQDLVDANTSFAQAVLASPTNNTANAFYAATRLLTLPYQPAGSNFLSRIGLPATGRNIYNWTASPPKDTNGILLAPAGVNANEFPAQLRTNVLFVLAGAISNLAGITDSNLTINLTSNETCVAAIAIDYGDLKLIQAGLSAAEYFTYTINAENLDVQLAALRALYTSGQLSASHLLTGYPQLFTFTTTNDLENARTTFTNAIDTYMLASDFIRARPTNEVRLFNYDPAEAKSEGDFRLVLQDLKNSLVDGAQIFSLNPALTVDMERQFANGVNLRGLLPRFDANAIDLGSLPDLTFGGMVDGLRQADIENFLSEHFTMLPVGNVPTIAGETASLTFSTLSGHYYVLESSTNLTRWEIDAHFTAVDVASSMVNPRPPGETERFYRLRDDTGLMTFAGIVLDQTTSNAIAGAQVASAWDGSSVLTDASGRFYLNTTLPSSYYEDELTISAPGYTTVHDYFYGDGLVSGLAIQLSPPPGNDDFANRVVLTGGSVSASGNNAGATVESGEPLDAGFSYGGRSVWFTWTAPSSGSFVFSVSTTNVFYPILALYTGTQITSLSTITDVVGSGNYASHTLNASAGDSFQIEVDDDLGNGGAYTLSIAQ